MKIQRLTYLSLGSNEGNKLDNLQQAVNQIAERIGRIEQISSVYRTASWGFEGDDFLNICLKVRTNLNPERLLQTVLKIEEDLGRKRTQTKTYKPRSIDIEVLLFEDEIIFYEDLKVPHPGMLERKFVLVPLAEIAPNVRHPIMKKTILICLQGCEDSSEIDKTDLKLIRLYKAYSSLAKVTCAKINDLKI